MSKIKKARERAGMTQAELATKVGVAQGTVAKWELGQAIPKLGVALKLARVLKLDVSRFQG